MGDRYRGRENSYTPPPVTELNGVDFGRGPVRAWGSCVRACVGARSKKCHTPFLRNNNLTHAWHASIALKCTAMANLRFAFRTLAKSPGFTLVTSGLLAVGIGANTL